MATPWQPLRILTRDGLQFLTVRSDRDASEVGRHWNAVRRYLDTGLSYDLAEFDGIELLADDEHGATHRVVLETDLDAIDMHALRGDVSFESIYDEVQ